MPSDGMMGPGGPFQPGLKPFATGSFITPAAGVTQLLARPRSLTPGSFVMPATGVTQPLAPSSCIMPATGITQLLAPAFVGTLPHLHIAFVGTPPHLHITFVGTLPHPLATFVGMRPRLHLAFVGTLPCLLVAFVGTQLHPPIAYAGVLPHPLVTFVGLARHLDRHAATPLLHLGLRSGPPSSAFVYPKYVPEARPRPSFISPAPHVRLAQFHTIKQSLASYE
ncbi:hypothetical protein B0H17DRAFT_1221714 [Mycena rosella]|uniref:Uncharacterized protein n=1 Tax=Mycena rosella TaxID=1033263 RepID=A0AAD7B0H5_MYCRO|nr:hypothetical protein B0H17DRAFT_1221714 [Mycena rosella]